jgi:hypothetical protein
MGGTVALEKLLRLPSPPPMPDLQFDNIMGEMYYNNTIKKDGGDTSSNLKCEWIANSETRVIQARFLRIDYHEDVNIQRLASLMERDDVTVLSTGILGPLNLSEYSLFAFECGLTGEEVLPYFRHCSSSNKSTTAKQNGNEYDGDNEFSMTLYDYFTYLDLQGRRLDGEQGVADTFTYMDQQNKEHTFHVDSDSVALVDLDMVKLMPALESEFRDSFRLPGMLPGGDYCMMNRVRLLFVHLCTAIV